MEAANGPGKALCACGKPVWKRGRSRFAPTMCVTCAELAIRAETVKRLTRSGKMAAMRRAMEACPDAQRTEAEPLRELTPAEELERELIVAMANAERDRGTDGECAVSPVRKGGRTVSVRPFNAVPIAHSSVTGLRYMGGKR